MIDKQLMYWRSTHHPYITVLKIPLALANVFKEFASNVHRGRKEIKCVCVIQSNTA